jgi:formamidopyrimidine-DNA glycosylase
MGMPELPEVETVRKDLQRLLRGRKAVDVVIRKKKMVKGSTRAFREKVKGKTIDGIKRRGKLLIVELGSGKRPSYAKATEGKWILIHLKMTGQLIYKDKKRLVGGGHSEPKVKKDKLPNKYSHIIFVFAGGGELYFNDMRQFGYVRLVNSRELKEVLSGFGVEPLSDSFTVEVLREGLKGRKMALKNILLDQRLVAGLGNIYVDEVCFLAGIRPTRRGMKVTKEEARRLSRAIRQVLKSSIARRGTTFNSYRDGLGGEGDFVRLLKVYGRAGQSCYRCRARLKRTRINGRGTVYCSKCQK